MNNWGEKHPASPHLWRIEHRSPTARGSSCSPVMVAAAEQRWLYLPITPRSWLNLEWFHWFSGIRAFFLLRLPHRSRRQLTRELSCLLKKNTGRKEGLHPGVIPEDLDALCVVGFSTLSCSFHRNYSATRLKVAAKADVIKKSQQICLPAYISQSWKLHSGDFDAALIPQTPA